MAEGKLGKPTAPIVTQAFLHLSKTNAAKKGMPNLRITYVPHPVHGKTPAQLARGIEGNDPVSQKPIMLEIVDASTKPLTADEKKTGKMEQSLEPKKLTDTPEALQQLFEDEGMTDYLPIVLPTEERVAA